MSRRLRRSEQWHCYLWALPAQCCYGSPSGLTMAATVYRHVGFPQHSPAVGYYLYFVVVPSVIASDMHSSHYKKRFLPELASLDLPGNW